MAKDKPKSNRGKYFLLMLMGAAVAAAGGIAQFAPEKLADLGPLSEHLTGDAKMKVRGIVFAVGGVMFLLFGKLTFKSKKKK